MPWLLKKLASVEQKFQGIQNQNGLAISMKNAVQVAGNLFTLCYKILSVTMKEQLPGEVCMN